MQTLKPCPFCGGKVDKKFDTCKMERFYSCPSCGAVADFVGKDKALLEEEKIAAWNRRTGEETEPCQS